MPFKTSAMIAATGAAFLTGCSGGSGGEGTSYDEQLSCYTALMGVNAANRDSGEELPGATNALLAMKAVEMEGGEKAQQVKEDIHAASSKIQDIMALKASPDGAAEFSMHESDAEACSEKFKS